MNPSLTLLVKLGSLAVHVDECLSADAHSFDLIAIKQLLADDELKIWIHDMTAQGFLPVKRSQ